MMNAMLFNDNNWVLLPDDGIFCGRRSGDVQIHPSRAMIFFDRQQLQ